MVDEEGEEGEAGKSGEGMTKVQSECVSGVVSAEYKEEDEEEWSCEERWKEDGGRWKVRQECVQGKFKDSGCARRE